MKHVKHVLAGAALLASAAAADTVAIYDIEPAWTIRVVCLQSSRCVVYDGDFAPDSWRFVSNDAVPIGAGMAQERTYGGPRLRVRGVAHVVLVDNDGTTYEIAPIPSLLGYVVAEEGFASIREVAMHNCLLMVKSPYVDRAPAARDYRTCMHRWINGHTRGGPRGEQGELTNREWSGLYALPQAICVYEAVKEDSLDRVEVQDGGWVGVFPTLGDFYAIRNTASQLRLPQRLRGYPISHAVMRGVNACMGDS